jgi:3',5'-cyclic AMP phosphodiesterase CpdA
VTAQLLHLSDLHVGAHDDAWDEIGDALRGLVSELRPELVVASGDLTHRNRAAQHERATALLRSLGPPVLAVPGNHDIPTLPPARFVKTFGAFRAKWSETEPVFRSERLHVVGVNSVRPWLYQGGAVSARQLARVGAEMKRAAPGALRVVVLHHHLCSAPWRTAKRAVRRRSLVIAVFAEAGADLVLSGHVHQSSVFLRSEFEVAAAGLRAMTVVNAPGLGRPRPHRHGEAAGLHAYAVEDGALRVLTYVLRERGPVLVADRRVARHGPA